jgi:DNA-binding MarR family transcriptional regulator
MSSRVALTVVSSEEQGYLERHPHPDDRRAKQLVLTAKGTELRERLLELLSENSPLSSLAPEEQHVLQHLLTRALMPDPL